MPIIHTPFPNYCWNLKLESRQLKQPIPKIQYQIRTIYLSWKHHFLKKWEEAKHPTLNYYPPSPTLPSAELIPKPKISKLRPKRKRSETRHNSSSQSVFKLTKRHKTSARACEIAPNAKRKRCRRRFGLCFLFSFFFNFPQRKGS